MTSDIIGMTSCQPTQQPPTELTTELPSRPIYTHFSSNPQLPTQLRKNGRPKRRRNDQRPRGIPTPQTPRRALNNPRSKAPPPSPCLNPPTFPPQTNTPFPPFSQHKPGVLVGNDNAPEFTAKTLPPGSAPADRTFKPNNISEVPGQADNPDVLRSHGKESTQTTAESTLGGATSGDVHQGLGKPIQGQSSSELHGGKAGAGREGGLVGVGVSGAKSGNQM
ncbi:MAG: hypothetical protein Q9173_007110, partial [Seirophora scorigena]